MPCDAREQERHGEQGTERKGRKQHAASFAGIPPAPAGRSGTNSGRKVRPNGGWRPPRAGVRLRRRFARSGPAWSHCGDSIMIVLEIALIVLSVAGFAVLDAYTRACERI